jgi:predicted metal-dependent hydrolase
MARTIHLGEISVAVTRKRIKHVHLSVHPPHGRVTLVTPIHTRPDVARAYAISKLGWIRKQQAALRGQAREAPRRFVERESHHLWGRRYLLSVVEKDQKPAITLGHRRMTLVVRPQSSAARRRDVMHAWHKALLHQTVPRLIEKWEARTGVSVTGYYLQRMKTKWGSCNHRSRHIRINTELVKKPKDLLDYVVLHEMLHLIEPSHSERFIALLDRYYPSWREARAELNALPLSSAAPPARPRPRRARGRVEARGPGSRR